MLKNNWGGEALGCSSSVPFQNMFRSAPCPKQGQNTSPVCYSLCCTSGGGRGGGGGDHLALQSRSSSLPCPLIKKSIPIRKRHFASLNTMKLILDWLENPCLKHCLLKFAPFLQYRAGKHRIILGTAYTCSLSSGSGFLYLIATRCLHFTDCRTNPSIFRTP